LKHIQQDSKEYSPSTSEMIRDIAKDMATVPKDGRRDFLKKGFLFSVTAAAAVGGVTKLQADSPINPNNLPPNNPEWGLKWGRDNNESPYGMPSKYEANVVRRFVPWLTADQKASVSFTPWQDLKGIIVPNGLHFTRCHGA